MDYPSFSRKSAKRVWAMRNSELFQQIKGAQNARPFFFRHRVEELLDWSPTSLIGVEFGGPSHVISTSL
jgi:hypothetical protein